MGITNNPDLISSLPTLNFSDNQQLLVSKWMDGRIARWKCAGLVIFRTWDQFSTVTPVGNMSSQKHSERRWVLPNLKEHREDKAIQLFQPSVDHCDGSNRNEIVESWTNHHDHLARLVCHVNFNDDYYIFYFPIAEFWK